MAVHCANVELETLTSFKATCSLVERAGRRQAEGRDRYRLSPAPHRLLRARHRCRDRDGVSATGIPRKHGADPDEMDENAGGNALQAAVRMRYTCDSTEFVRMLLAAGANRRITTRNGMTALQLAEDCARRQSDTASDEASQEFTRDFEGVAEVLRNA